MKRRLASKTIHGMLKGVNQNKSAGKKAYSILLFDLSDLNLIVTSDFCENVLRKLTNGLAKAHNGI